MKDESSLTYRRVENLEQLRDPSLVYLLHLTKIANAM